MTPDAPLSEVAKLLPMTAARLLMDESAQVQALAVSIFRHQVLFWEANGVVLDPVAFDVIVTSLVMVTTTVYATALRGEDAS